MCKNVIIYVFPEIIETKIRFFPGKCQPQFRVFTKIWGRRFQEFPGISVDKITKNSIIYVFHEMLKTKFRFFPENFHEIPKSPIFLNFRKPQNFGEIVTSSKKTPNFQFSVGFSLNFVQLIGYTSYSNLYTQLHTPKHDQTPKKLIFKDVGHKILENSRFFPKIGVPSDKKTPFFKESSANLKNEATFW